MRQERTKHDQLFKKLLTEFFFEFIALFLPEVLAYIRRDPPQFLDKELFADADGKKRKEVDLVAKLKFRDSEAFLLIHIENQDRSRRGFVRRVFHYLARLDEKFDLPIYPVALLSYDAPQRPEPDRYQIVFPDRTVLDFSLRVIQLNRLNWRDFLRKPNPVAAALMTKMAIAPADRPKVKLECMRMIATLRLDPRKTQVIREFVETYLELNADEVKAYQKEVASIDSTERKAVMAVTGDITAGGMRKVILKVLASRFGPISRKLVRQLEYTPHKYMDELSDVILKFQTLADFEVWLKAHRGPSQPNARKSSPQ